MLAAALAAGTPRTGRAGQLTVTENLPNTGVTKTEILGAGANTPLSSGQSYSGPIPSIETADGRFRFVFNDISAADPKGFPTLTGSMTLVNLDGGQGSLFLDFKQLFVPSPIFNNGCFDTTALVGTFTESSVHGNNVVGVGLVLDRFSIDPKAQPWVSRAAFPAWILATRPVRRRPWPLQFTMSRRFDRPTLFWAE